MSVRRPLAALSAALLTCAGLAAGAGTASAAPAAPLADYIVTLAEDAPQAAALAQARGLGGRIGHTYRHALNGFSVSVPAASAARLSRLPGVVAVEPDLVVQAKPVRTQTPTPPALPWGLDRIDQTNLPLNEAYRPGATGSGVTAYVIDSGIRLDHEDFTDRIETGYDAIDGGTPDDCNGHGTHVAGTLGGTRRGVAPGVSLVPVRVLDCRGSGSISQVIAGVNWIIANHPVGVPAVANMSLGGAASTALDTAIGNSVAAGVTYAVAAGNGDRFGRPLDACATSPAAAVLGALTVAATDRTDSVASFSNYGTCVDVYAPGVGILSDWYTSGTATNTISGTSMASPHVAGAAAVYLQAQPRALPSAVAAAITGTATPGVVENGVSTTPNRLLFVQPAAAVAPTTS